MATLTNPVPKPPPRRQGADVQEMPVRRRDVVISGVGLVTPLGFNARESWQALLAGQFITDHYRAPFVARDGEARVVELARRAAREATSDVAILSGDDQTALVVGTSKGPIEQWIADAGREPPAGLSDVGDGLAGLGELARTIGDELDLRGPRLTVSGACASGLHALIRAAMMIRSGAAKRALVVAAEASVHPLFISSFRRLGVLPPDGWGCRPFDRERRGFLMSESAAAVVLSDGEAAFAGGGSGPGVESQILIDRFVLGADASHLTAASADARVLRRLLGDIASAGPIDLVHAHGTGTISNDVTELAAIDAVIGAAGCDLPATVYSHKGALGHSLGAAGLVSIVLNCLAHREQIVPGNVRTLHPLPARNCTISRGAVHRRVHRSVAIASGFGGATAAVSLVLR